MKMKFQVWRMLAPSPHIRKIKGGSEKNSTLVTFKAIDPPCPPY